MFTRRLKKVNTLYHATFPTRVESIKEQGILRNTFGVIYMCADLEDIHQFTHGIMNRWAHEFAPDQYDVTIIDGKEEKFPKIIYHDKVAVFKIDATKLDWHYMNEGTDHNPNFYTADVYMYGDSVPPEYLKEVIYIPFGE